MPPRRCALGCPFSKPYHRFPHAVKNPDRFKEWVCIAGGKLDSQDEIELYRKKFICDIHFTDKVKNRNNRLNFLAVPTLHLDGKADEVDSAEKEVEGIPKKCTKHDAVMDVSSSQGVKREPEENIEGIPKKCTKHDAVMDVSGSQGVKREPEENIDLSDHETSTQMPESELILGHRTSYEIHKGLSDYKASTHVSPLSETILEFPSPIPKETFTFSGALDITSAKTSPIIKSEHSYCAEAKTDITKARESKYYQPIPNLIVNQLQIARKRVKQLQSEISRLRKRNKIVTTRLINAKKNSKHNCLQKITQNMTAAAKTFTHMQFTQTQKRNRGRRFTCEGQRLSLSIYKSSPQCYDLLSKIFTLPSAKTLKKFSKKFDVQPGLNNSLNEAPIQPATFSDELYYMHCGDIF